MICAMFLQPGSVVVFKGALDKYNIIPNFFQKKLRFLYH